MFIHHSQQQQQQQQQWLRKNTFFYPGSLPVSANKNVRALLPVTLRRMFSYQGTTDSGYDMI
jgi:hypothetical protein